MSSTNNINRSTVKSMQSPLVQGASATKISESLNTDEASNNNKGINKLDSKNVEVNISTHAKDRAEALQRAFDIAKNTADTREDKIAALKKKIAEGEYKLDSGAIADGILREAVKDHLATSEER